MASDLASLTTSELRAATQEVARRIQRLTPPAHLLSPNAAMAMMVRGFPPLEVAPGNRDEINTYKAVLGLVMLELLDRDEEIPL